MKTLKFLGLAAVSAFGLALAAPSTAQQSDSQQAENQLKDPPSAFLVDKRRASWHAEVQRTERGFMIGNPKAEASLIEWISYTCPACANFAREGEGAMDLALLAPGHMNVEVRPVIRNAIDLTVSMLVQCGGEEEFKERHRMFMMGQRTWLPKVQSAPQTQLASWSSGNKAARLSMASALGFDDMLANRGVSRMDISTCLSNDEAAQALVQNGSADRTEFSVTSTPSFALDGERLADVHGWNTLYPVIAERFKPENSSQ
ncbi:thioredoxin domain-containing protein [Erythrobacter sp. SCSIO 43205]|uniref:DsbA family protein n=1 Tax=Erythrobacter sp. SCSIO 43205 TaxID=2779361 RepID=UPI001CA7F74F|nr:thioredoxin domain-containing protein [Erythrobacter sp. SCSIO 43205]UAB77690.1 thioredoxin domain-containing protein [Erythrobacter sp. SCSIO 43205]